MYFFLKCALSGVIVALVSEIARRSSLFAAVTASLPLTSILAFVWIYRDSGDVRAVAEISRSIAWLVLPSILFFVVLTLGLTRWKWPFYPTLAASSVAMAAAYFVYSKALSALGVQI